MLFTWASMHIFSKRDDYQRFAKRRVLLIAVTSSKEMKNEYFFDYSSKRVARYTSLFVTLFDVWLYSVVYSFRRISFPKRQSLSQHVRLALMSQLFSFNFYLQGILPPAP